MELKNKACDTLLAHRVDNKIKGTKVNSIINRIHVAQPKPRDDVARPPFIPDVVKDKKKYDKNDPERRRLLKDQELEEGGPGVFNINLRGTGSSFHSVSEVLINIAENYILANPEWKMDIIPEIMDGKNIADFIDPDIAEKLEALEREEEKLQAEGYYDSDSDIVSFCLSTTLFCVSSDNNVLSSTLRMNAKLDKPKSLCNTRSNLRASKNQRRTKRAFLALLAYVLSPSLPQN